MKFILFLLVVAGVVMAVKYGPDYLEQRKKDALSLDHLSSDVSGDLDTLSRAFEAPDPGVRPPVVRGKPLVFTLKGNANLRDDPKRRGEKHKDNPERFGDPPCVDQLMRALPGELLAESKNDVGTLIGLKWGRQFIHSYGASGGGVDTGPDALQETCEIVVVDKQTGKLLAKATAFGGKPPTQLKRNLGRDEFGNRCDAQVIDYVASLFLPERPVKSIFEVRRGKLEVDQPSP